MSKKLDNIFEFAAQITKIGNRAVKKAQDRNRRLGVANVYSKRGQIYYQLPDGTITTRKPEKSSS